jgi:hypothetical protein
MTLAEVRDLPVLPFLDCVHTYPRLALCRPLFCLLHLDKREREMYFVAVSGHSKVLMSCVV